MDKLAVRSTREDIFEGYGECDERYQKDVQTPQVAEVSKDDPNKGDLDDEYWDMMSWDSGDDE